MDLTPLVADETEDARGADGENKTGGGAFVDTAFAAHGVEDVSCNMQSVTIERGGDVSGAGKEALIDAADFGPAALDATQRIIHGDVVGGTPIFLHERDVAVVEGAIELSEGVARVGEVAQIFLTGDGVKFCGYCG